MDKKIGMYSAIINVCSVASFAVSMLMNFDFGSYIASMFIAFSFVPMIATFCYKSTLENKVAGYTSVIFAGIYVTLIVLVYFAQVTSVRIDDLNEETLKIVDYSRFGLFFNYDLLGYGFMALSTFFTGFTINSELKSNKWLKRLLLIHGVFFISCFIMPMLGVFNAEMNDADWVGVVALEFWCIYFIPVGILSFLYFKEEGKE